jgi:hypothetical protein
LQAPFFLAVGCFPAMAAERYYFTGRYKELTGLDFSRLCEILPWNGWSETLDNVRGVHALTLLENQPPLLLLPLPHHRVNVA